MMSYPGTGYGAVFRFRDREFSDFLLPSLMALVYFAVAADFSGPALAPVGGDALDPWLAGAAWVFLGVAILYPALGNYALPRKDPAFSVPVVVTLGAYSGLALVITLMFPVFGLFFVVGTLGATLGMFAAMHHDEAEGVTWVKLIEGYVLSLILLSIFVAIVGATLQVTFGVSTSILDTPQYYLVIAVSLFLGTVLGDYLESPSGIVGYFAGTDAVFYSFILTSIFVLLALWGIGGYL